MTPHDDADEGWQRVSSERSGVAPELRALVATVCREIRRKPTDRSALQSALEDLLSFLSSSHGRTDANCRTVDYFFCMPEVYGLSVNWDHVPEEFQDILQDLAMGLHDTITAPDIARRCDSTPEQLLEKLRRIIP